MSTSLPYAVCLGAAFAAFTFWCLSRLNRTLQAAQSPEMARDLRNAERAWSGSTWQPLLPLIKFTARFYEGRDGSTMSQKVMQKLLILGNPLNLTYPDFLAICQWTGVAIAAFAALLGFAVCYLGGIGYGIMLGFTAFGGLAGFGIPWYYLFSDADEKIRSINKDLPYALDLMLLMVDGGASIQEAFDAASREESYGPLGEELMLVNREIQHGTVLSNALDELARRIPSDDLVLIIQAINQGLAMGTPISSTFRDQADLLRAKRTERAEKIAKKAGSKMIFPIILIMMATFILVLGPAVMQMGGSSLQ